MIDNSLNQIGLRLANKKIRTRALILAGLISAISWSMGWSWPAVVLAGLAGFVLAAILGVGESWNRSNRIPFEAKDEKSAEDALHQGLRSIIGLLELPACVVDQNNRIEAFNIRARELFTEIETGRPLFQVSRHPQLTEGVRRAQAEQVPQIIEMAESGLRGRRLLATISPLPVKANSQGAATSPLPPALFIQFRDLSEQDRLARLRSDFIANASHELRTPLASIKGFIETLQGPASGDPVAREKFLNIMENQAARMNRILDDLLSLSRIEMREHLPPSIEIDINSVLKSVVESLAPVAAEANIALTLSLPDTASLVRGERDELVQVFQNLIQNAIKYGNEGGKVDVQLKLEMPLDGDTPKVVISVTDDGPGIAEEHLPRLTERFYRVDTAKSRERGGTGLGLAIVKHIVNRHRGELRVTSVLGRGSTFTVILDSIRKMQH
jgi:two-component system phosphate regulon sensor histidine kinase PhoR